MVVVLVVVLVAGSTTTTILPVVVPDAETCGSLSITDAMNAFDWVCDDASRGANPIMAQNYHHSRGRIRGLNAQIALMGALGKVGELLNRPSSATTTSTPYISSTSVSNGDTNILGGLLEGGFNSLEQQVSQQNQQEIQDILSRPNVWYVPAGDGLQIFINSSFQVGS